MGQWEPNLGKSDEWYTPAYVFEALGCRFDLDVASPEDPSTTCVPARRFISSGGLTAEWSGFVWMNPPFGGRNGLVPWLNKFISHGNGIALTPDRTSAPWFQTTFRRVDVAMFTPRIRFIKPDGSEGAMPTNGTALLGIGPAAFDAIQRAKAAGLGVVAYPGR